MEEWIVIEGHPDYEVSNQGNVRSNKNWRGKKSIIMKPSTRGYDRNYQFVKLDNIRHSIHHLVATAFIPNTENKPTVDHIDRNTFDNCVENLRWATYSEQSINQKHSASNTRQKHISLHSGGFQVTIRRSPNTYKQTFKTLQDAINFRDETIQRLHVSA
jgi:hypothetical protein